MVLVGEEGSVCGPCRWGHNWSMHQSLNTCGVLWMNHVQMVPNVVGSLVKARSFQLECGRVLHKALLVPILLYGSEKKRKVDRMLTDEKIEKIGLVNWTYVW